jgi:hypothetical protein
MSPTAIVRGVILVVITVLDDSFQRDVDTGVLCCHCRDDAATIAATATSVVHKGVMLPRTTCLARMARLSVMRCGEWAPSRPRKLMTSVAAALTRTANGSILVPNVMSIVGTTVRGVRP